MNNVENQIIDVLISAYTEKNAIKMLLQRIGVPSSDLDLDGETKAVWHRTWVVVGNRQRTDALVGEVLNDPAVQRYHLELRRLRARGERPAEPEPAQQDPRFRTWSAELKEAYDRREDLVSASEGTSEIDQHILELRRKFREGPSLRAGDSLEGRYKLLEVVGQGGFGQVWKAYDREQRRVVALKVLHGQWSQDKSKLDRFFSGARHMAELRHPAIVGVMRERVDDGGFYFFVMDYVSGGDLHEAVLSRRIDRQVALRAVIQVGEALAYSHARGLVHRDVKPHNILLDEQDRAYLTDFDLVHALDTTHGTRTSAGVGTYLYAAPELLEDAATSDARADVYGLAMTAAFCLYGARLPQKALYGRVLFIDNLSVSGSIKEVLRTALSEERELRTADAVEFCKALLEAIELDDGANSVVVRSDAHRVQKVETLVANPQSTLEGESNPVSTTKSGEYRLFEATGLRIEAVWIPAGTFWMGSSHTKDEPGYDADAWKGEAPFHQVAIPRGFWLSRFPVINSQYRVFVGATEAEEPFSLRTAGFSGSNQPVAGVGWYEALMFCRWLTRELGWLTVDLPTEAEWEWSARGEDRRRYPWGDAPPDRERACFGAESSGPVGLRSPGRGPFGAEDQAGNVLEWCKSVYRDYELAPEIDDHQLDDSESREGDTAHAAPRVVRGGSWQSEGKDLRCALRYGLHPESRFRFIGFRPVFRATM